MLFSAALHTFMGCVTPFFCACKEMQLCCTSLLPDWVQLFSTVCSLPFLMQKQFSICESLPKKKISILLDFPWSIMRYLPFKYTYTLRCFLHSVVGMSVSE